MKTIKILFLFMLISTVSCAQQSPKEQATGTSLSSGGELNLNHLRYIVLYTVMRQHTCS